ncbi:MAG: citrate/2-methylcitrate synthase, partial [Deltaproteobacteria bacterium]|nr:citrate/2-methylcitrate synthase [Deltaproteobacteria bacterium]
MHQETAFITELILEAAEAARQESSDEPEFISADAVDWPVTVTLGPGLEGAIACETTVGYVNGAKGQLSYRGYDIFDLCAHATYEEVSYLLLHGSLPNAAELETFKRKLTRYRSVTKTLRLLMGFPIEEMNTMGALRLGTNMMRQEFTILDQEQGRP